VVSQFKTLYSYIQTLCEKISSQKQQTMVYEDRLNRADTSVSQLNHDIITQLEKNIVQKVVESVKTILPSTCVAKPQSSKKSYSEIVSSGREKVTEGQGFLPTRV